MIAEFMETGLNAELDEHSGYNRYDTKEKDTDGSRIGHISKMLRTSFGYPAIQIPRNRKGEFDP